MIKIVLLFNGVESAGLPKRSVIPDVTYYTHMSSPKSTYFGRTFSRPVTMIEVGLEARDKVETGEVDAEEALEVVNGVKAGDSVNTDGPVIGDDGGEVGVGDVLDACRPVVAIGISLTLTEGRAS